MIWKNFFFGGGTVALNDSEIMKNVDRDNNHFKITSITGGEEMQKKGLINTLRHSGIKL